MKRIPFYRCRVLRVDRCKVAGAGAGAGGANSAVNLNHKLCSRRVGVVPLRPKIQPPTDVGSWYSTQVYYCTTLEAYESLTLSLHDKHPSLSPISPILASLCRGHNPPTSAMASSGPSRSSSEKDVASAQSAASTPTLSVPNSAVDKTPDDTSKLRMFLGILKKYDTLRQTPAHHGALPDATVQASTTWLTLELSRFIGVSDIASVRFSLPAQLMEPIPNLGLRCHM